ncbi:ATP-binding cassette domain-containing protein [Sandarakinorhabdus sp.]|uniref:ATP-binding cassette domain-containing protein n=1 Tax=Sandarakinorhabdus sp. TaxID=1916663 RepID=UPI00286E1656|nr:ATP-binding cassette domain-containing protein [Sandarakinorhabdus sp.]
MSAAIRAHGAVALDVAIDVAPGQTMALVGASGAGKTSVLRAIAGLMLMTGHVRVGGHVWQDSAAGVLVPTRRRRIGMVFQDGALFPHMTALENIAQAMPGDTDARDRAAALLAQVQLAGLENRRPAQLSGGQQARVALARALARDPEILLLDEPFAAVDRPVRRALLALVAQVRASSDMPILFVTHDMAEAAASADTLCFLVDGHSIETGPAQALLANPSSRVRRWLDG